MYAGNDFFLSGGNITLDDIMIFFCGTTDLKAISLEERVPMIEFMDSRRLPTASTCALWITFPRYFAELQFEQFREKMDFCIIGSQGFGGI